MKGIHPTPLSTETIFSSGWRSKMPERIPLITTRALPMKSIVPPMAGLTLSCCEGQGYFPKKVIPVTLAPMWKCTGSCESAHTSQNGSHARLARSGAPRSCGIRGHVDAPDPEAGDPLGLPHALVDVPRGHERQRQQPIARLGLDLGHGVVVDLDGERGAARGRRPRRGPGPPRPIVLGKMTWASIPHSSSTPRRTSGSYAPTWTSSMLPLDQAAMSALLGAVPPDDAARAETADRVAVEDPHRLAVDLLDSGHPVPECAGARLVKRSGASVPVRVGIDDEHIVQH